MTTLTVCTGWSPKGYIEYGARFLETFERHWPADVQLVVYGEEPCDLPRGEFIQLSEVPGCLEFIKRHKNNLAAQGKKVDPTWKPSAQRTGYNFRFDAWKFCRQGFIPMHAAARCNTELLCWLDGDVVTLKDIPWQFIQSLLPKDKDVAYLGRDHTHSEIGFQLYRIPHAFPLLSEFRTLYNSDRVFRLKEWHSAYVFDTARQLVAPERLHNLTPGGRGHVWVQSPLAEYTDHVKGKRKTLGYSPERGK